MSSKLKYCVEKNLIGRGQVPDYLLSGLQYEVIMGSIAYGCNEDYSDFDIYGYSIPPREIVYPHLAGVIPGFGNQGTKFDQFQMHHVEDKNKKRVYDFSIYNIVKYFQLVMQNNPNMIDSLFVPDRCVLFSSVIGNYVRENRKVFLHKGAFQTFSGYAYSQLNKMKNKQPEGKRIELVKKYGFDVKFGMHLCRLLDEVEQILVEGDLNLEKNAEQLKAIRNGQWSLAKIEQYAYEKQCRLNELYVESELPKYPDEDKIKKILVNCLDMFYNTETVKDFSDEGLKLFQNFIEDITQTMAEYRHKALKIM